MPARSRPSKLSNCYTLLPLPSSSTSSSLEIRQEQLKTRDSGDGTDRSPDAIRRLYLESGSPTASDTTTCLTAGPTGSSLVEIGHTKVVCHVVVAPAGDDNFAEPSSSIIATVQYAPFAYPVDHIVASSTSAVGSISAITDTFGAPRMIRSTLQARQADLSARLTTALAAQVPWPPQAPHTTAPITASVLQIHLVVLQDDGGVLAACLAAASLALADASVQQYDVVVCGSVACFRNNSNVTSESMTFLADPDYSEFDAADATMTLAMLPNMKEVVVWEQTGCLSLAEANQAMETCRNGCRTMHRFLRQHWIDKHQSTAMQE